MTDGHEPLTMSFWQTCFGSEEESRRTELDRRLQAFYSSVDNYEAFREKNWKPEFWQPIRAAIETYAVQRGCKVLEIGAGRTSFAEYLSEIRDRVDFHVQDITGRNYEYLSGVADKVWICEPTALRNRYDVVFGTFVYEHLTRPRATLEHLLTLLEPGGSIFLASPRYDFPGYLSPSARHLSCTRQMMVAAQLLMRRFKVLLGSGPLFLIHYDPAAFHASWFRDSDAVHWPSWWDLKRALPCSFSIERLRLQSRGLRGWFWERFLLLFVRIRAPEERRSAETWEATNQMMVGSSSLRNGAAHCRRGMESRLLTIGDRFHPLNRLRRNRAGRAILKACDLLVWVTMPGVHFKVRARLFRHLRIFCSTAGAEPGIVALFRTLASCLGIRSFWDIGANVGYYSWLVKSLAPSAEIRMFEPEADNVMLIRQTIARTPLSLVACNSDIGIAFMYHEACVKGSFD